MGVTTKIPYCDSSWNPISGCYHNCEYCYARRIANRFDGGLGEGNGVYVLDEPICPQKPIGNRGAFLIGKPMPYPYGFRPTYHRYRLNVPQLWVKPRNIFVCSMADLFGDWVEDEWIDEIMQACRKAPQHRYLFLTKNPDRYDDLENKGIIKNTDQNFWLGSTVTVETRDKMHYNSFLHTFQSCEPMLAPWPPAGQVNQYSLMKNWLPEWVIFGAETGNRRNKVVPEKSWLDNAVEMCRNMGAKVFMKESLREIMGDDFIQEFPWDT